MSGKANTTMRSLDRAMQVLRTLEDSRAYMRISEISAATNLPAPTVHRILSVLTEYDFVQRDDGQYTMGPATLFAAHAYLNSSWLAVSARPIVEELARATGLTASLFVRSGHSRAVVCRVEGARPLDYELPIGERLPLHLSAGKVLLAYLPNELLEPVLECLLPSETADGRRVEYPEFVRTLEQIRDDGYYISTNERVLGMRSVSAPVRTRSGKRDAALLISGRSDEVSAEQIERFAWDARQASSAISMRLTGKTS